MDFDDSLFQQEDVARHKRLDASNVKYTAKRCELNWFNQVPEPSVEEALTGATSNTEGNFMLLKYRADLLYFKKAYQQAAAEYETVLKEAPSSNAVVHREVTDSLARCLLHMGEYGKALKKAQMLVQPPHENGWNAWKLIAACQKSLNDITGHVISLQKCTSLQRYQPGYWTCLAKGYRTLGQMFKSHPVRTSTERVNDSASSSSENMYDWSSLMSILENTVALFRPYFSWRSLPKISKTNQDGTATTTNGDCTSLCEKLSRLDIQSPTSGHLSYCHKCCIFNELPHCKSYSDIILTVYKTTSQTLCVNFEPCSSMCLVHSPFPVLLSGQITVTDFCFLLENLSYLPIYSNFLSELLQSFFLMAEYSCLLWTRQLLMYFERYSHSFVRDAREVELDRVEQLLVGYNGDMRTVLELFFNKKRVFDESQAT